MKIIEQSVEIITEPNPLKRIELVGRVCWKSEHRITEDSAKPFVAGLIKRGHTSPLEHARVVVPPGHEMYYLLNCYDHFFYGIKNRIIHDDKGNIFANMRDYVNVRYAILEEHFFQDDFISEVENLKNADDYMTVKFITDIGMSRELIRHRQMSFMELSTRYVNYQDGIEFVKPEWYENEICGRDHIFRETVLCCEENYQWMIRCGCKPQEARAILPLCTKTELYMTGMLSQWKDVFALRESPAAHPQMRALMELLRQEMEKHGIEVK